VTVTKTNLPHEAEAPFVLDNLTFEPEIAPLKKRLRIRDGSTAEAELAALLPTAVEIAKPKALYRLVYIDKKAPEQVTIDGVTLRSRVLRVNLEAAYQAIVYVATCGVELHEWGESMDDMVHRYWADIIKEMALRDAMQALNKHLATCYKLGKTAVMSPGSLADWPIREQRPLFKILGDPTAAIGVTLTDSFLMIPNKSVSGIRFPTEASFESCQLCPREGCPGRRAAHEPDLYERKYQ
jgi:hypothetical protein